MESRFRKGTCTTPASCGYAIRRACPSPSRRPCSSAGPTARCAGSRSRSSATWAGSRKRATRSRSAKRGLSQCLKAASPSPRARPGFVSRQVRSSSSFGRAPFDLTGLPGVDGVDLRVTREDGRTYTAADAELVDRRGGARRRTRARARRARGRRRRVLSRVRGRGRGSRRLGGDRARLPDREPRARPDDRRRRLGPRAAPRRARHVGDVRGLRRGPPHGASPSRSGTAATATHAASSRSRSSSRSPTFEDASDPGYRERWEWSELSGRHVSNWISAEVGGGPISVVVPQLADTLPLRPRLRRRQPDGRLSGRSTRACWS